MRRSAPPLSRRSGKELQQPGCRVAVHADLCQIGVVRPERQRKRESQRKGVSIVWITHGQALPCDLEVAGVALGRTDVERQELPLELEELQRDAVLGGQLGKILVDFLDVELCRVDRERVFGEDAEGRFSESGGEEDVRVSDDAFGKL